MAVKYRQGRRADEQRHIAGVVQDILRPDVHRVAWSQQALADELKVSQTSVCNWLNQISLPRRRNRDKLLAIHQRAICHHWDCDELVPICAFAKTYPEELRRAASHALARALHAAPVSVPTSLLAPAGLRVDLHIRGAALPEGVSAYTFVNDPSNPVVFVVLVREDIGLSQQAEIAWHEVYAHVVKYRAFGAAETQPIVVLPSPVQHHKINTDRS
jgi:hypothetical protein